MRYPLVLVLIAISTVSFAGTIYKTVDANGKVVYSDQPPATGQKVEKQINVSDLPYTPVPNSYSKYTEELEKSMQKRLADQAKAGNAQPILFAATWCSYCIKAKAYLSEKNIGYQEYDIDTVTGKQTYATLAGGGQGIPLLVVNGKKTIGFSREAYDAVFSAPQ